MSAEFGLVSAPTSLEGSSTWSRLRRFFEANRQQEDCVAAVVIPAQRTHNDLSANQVIDHILAAAANYGDLDALTVQTLVEAVDAEAPGSYSYKSAMEWVVSYYSQHKELDEGTCMALASFLSKRGKSRNVDFAAVSPNSTSG